LTEEKSLYGLWKLMKDNKLDFKKKPILNGTIPTVNGTCFFVTEDIFITCNHILNSETLKENYVFLFNNEMIHNYVEIIYENKNYDLTIGKTKTPTKHYLNWCNKSSYEKGERFKLYGHPALNETIKILLLSKDKSIELLRISKKPIILEAVYERSQSISEEGVIADNGIHVKNCNVHILTPEASPGFSGSPLLSNENEIIGMQSLGVDTKINGKMTECSVIIDIKSIVKSIIKI
jgi:hypothetical protein